mmetsp:Transcript_6921/g.10513  ORF Transcript_6921/g.10513 Transcript_6921/m.10513 type:complete len:501 (-) Transcript_6921:399-1901(-)
MVFSNLLLAFLLPTMAVGQCDDLFANLDVEINLFGFAKYAVFGIYDWSLLTTDRDILVTFGTSDNWSTFKRSYCLERNTLHEVYVDSLSADGVPDGQVTGTMNGHVMFDDQPINDRFQSRLFYPDRATCKTGWTRVKLVIQFGDFPETITWDLKENDSVIFSSSSTYEASRNAYSDIFYQNILVVDRCVGGGNYKFEIKSSNGEGLGNDGYYEIYTDDEMVATKTENFGRSSTELFSIAGAGFCFSGGSMVTVKEKGAVRMSDLVLGDFVQVAKDQYEPIYSFGHKHGSNSAEYLQITTKSSHAPLEVSPNHMVSVEGDQYVPASLLKVGDRLVSTQNELAEVTKIKIVIRQGAFAPFTASGSIVVNEIVASNYIAYHESEYFKLGGFETPFTNQWMAHTFNSVHRLTVQIMGIPSKETYTADGVSYWVDWPHQLTIWLLNQHVLVSSFLIGLTLTVVSLARGIEIIIMTSPIVMLHLIGALLVLFIMMHRYCSKKKATV